MGLHPGAGRRVASLAMAGLLVADPAALRGQTVSGDLTLARDGSPVEGALVLLLDEEGEEVSGALTDVRGVFRLTAPNPGRFRLRAVRIGLETVMSEPMHLTPEYSSSLHLVAAEKPIELEGLAIRGTQKCRIVPEEGLVVARVWEEIAKALAIQEWTGREGLFRFIVSLYTRDVPLNDEGAGSEVRELVEVEGRLPMQSASAELLVSEGFVRELGNGTFEYYAPDAETLLSPAFLNTHCIRLVSDDEEPTLVGLRFEPRGDEDFPDVEGTLWVNRSGAELQYLEYRYTWVPYNRGRNRAGGRVDFAAMANGAWIITRRRIRMPTVERVDLVRARLQGFRETGAEVVSVTPIRR